jgi:hypothetical protein
MKKRVAALVVGDVILDGGGGHVEVLTPPTVGSDGRAHFDGRDEHSEVKVHRIVPTWDVEIQEATK